MAFYRAAWRWHFYAGVFVTPFLLLLTLTGLVMLFAPQLECLQYRTLFTVTPDEIVKPRLHSSVRHAAVHRSVG